MNRSVGWPVLILCLVLPFAVGAAEGADPGTLERAYEVYKKGDYRQAEALLSGYLEKEPRDAMAHYAMGLVQDKMGNYAAALVSFREAYTLNPRLERAARGYAAVTINRVQQLVAQQKFDRALDLADRSLELLPPEMDHYAWFARGVALFERWRQTDEAADRAAAFQAWEKVRELKPLSATADLLNGISAFEGRDPRRALELFKISEYKWEANTYTQMWIGLAHAALGDYAEAEKRFQKSLELFGQNPSIYRYLGDIHALQGDYEGAESHYHKALELKPDDSRIYASLAEIYKVQGRIPEAIDAYVKATRRPTFETYYQLGVLYRRSLDASRAVEAFRKAMEIASSDSGLARQARAAVQLGLTYLDMGEEAKAMEAASGYLSHVSAQDLPYRYLYQGRVGYYQDRLENLKKALEYRGPGANEVHVQAFLAWGDLERARKERVNALELYHQAWRRISAEDPRRRLIAAKFDKTRREEIEHLEKLLGGLFFTDPTVAAARAEALERRKKGIERMDLGEPGELVAGRGSQQAVRVSIVPAELEGDLTVEFGGVSAPAEGVPVTPAWQSGGK